MKNVKNTMQTQFNNGTWDSVVDDDFVIDYWGSPEYPDVDMHSGWSIVHNGIMPSADIFETHLPNTPISEPATPRNEWHHVIHSEQAA